ncbi:MAG: hypothetical protein M1820_004478 [Bogoriella megaspora]|nr:MAG: hypothetical protein M1820_004478 [Bogoriella megaspora]
MPGNSAKSTGRGAAGSSKTNSAKNPTSLTVPDPDISLLARNPARGADTEKKDPAEKPKNAVVPKPDAGRPAPNATNTAVSEKKNPTEKPKNAAVPKLDTYRLTPNPANAASSPLTRSNGSPNITVPQPNPDGQSLSADSRPSVLKQFKTKNPRYKGTVSLSNSERETTNSRPSYRLGPQNYNEVQQSTVAECIVGSVADLIQEAGTDPDKIFLQVSVEDNTPPVELEYECWQIHILMDQNAKKQEHGNCKKVEEAWRTVSKECDVKKQVEVALGAMKKAWLGGGMRGSDSVTVLYQKSTSSTAQDHEDFLSVQLTPQ